MRGLLRNVRAYLTDGGIEFKNKYKHIDDFSWLFYRLRFYGYTFNG